MTDLKSTKAWHIQNLIQVDDDCQVVLLCDALALEKERDELAAQVERLQSEFPLFDDDGLCEREHCCEFTLLQERKRLHKILSEPPFADMRQRAQEASNGNTCRKGY